MHLKSPVLDDIPQIAPEELSLSKPGFATGPKQRVQVAIDQSPRFRQEGPMLILKILRRAEWTAFRDTGVTLGAPVDLADGFMHFSTAAQIAETAARHFAAESDLVLLACESGGMGPDLKWESSRGGALFPHLYRPLRLEEVLWDKSLPLGASGHIFPEGVF